MRSGSWGELLACPDIHTGDGHLLEGLCESGTDYACNGHASEVECCQGHYQGQVIGSTGQCSWLFTGGFGSVLGRTFLIIIHAVSSRANSECGRSDEVVMGRCSTGGGHTGNGDCPDGNVHGIYCCEIDVLQQ